MNKSVLVVDDNLLTRQLLKRIVSKHACDVTLAINGSLALDKLLEDIVVDFIITDYKMPVLDGFNFLKALRSQESLKKIPVLFYSAFLGELDPTQFVGLGPVILKNKPIRKDVIQEFLSGDQAMFIS